MQAKRLRICIISREYPPETGWGGIATFANHLAHGLVENGHEVEVISLAKQKAYEIVQDGITIHRVEHYFKANDLCMVMRAMPYSRYVLNTSPAMWQKFLELHNEKPFDVVDAPELLAEGFFQAISKVAPLVVRLYTPHSKFIAERLHNVSPSFDHQFVAMVERAAMLFADAITSPSQDLAEYVAADLNYPLDQITLVANPIDPKEFCPDGTRAIDAPKQLKILFVGRLEERKGINYLVQAIPEVVKSVPQVHFYIIGDDTNNAAGQTSVLAGLKQFIDQSNCQAHVTFINRVPLVDLPAYYRSADVCVVPSVYDNSPYTCLEAMSCGKPVIGTTAGGTKEYLVDRESGILVEPKKPDAIAQAIISLLQNERERKRLSANARARVLEKFQRSAIADQMTNLYQEAIARFKACQKLPLYTKASSSVLSDMEELMLSFDDMLHEMLFKRSIRYRIATFMHEMKTRPKLCLAEKILALLKKISPDYKSNQSSPVVWLERQILFKKQEILDEDKRARRTESKLARCVSDKVLTKGR